MHREDNDDGRIEYRATRREAMRRALVGAAGLCLADCLAIRAWAAAPAASATIAANRALRPTEIMAFLSASQSWDSRAGEAGP